MSKPSLRRITVDDLGSVAEVHILAFPDSALSFLGPEAVRRYYEWQLLGPHDSFAVLVEGKEEILGFCFGGVSRGALSGFLQANRGFLVRSIAQRPWLVFNPIILERLRLAIRILRLAGKWQPSFDPAKNQQLKSFGILAIAVNPSHQGSGLAQQLMEAAQSTAVEAGFERMHLTVHPGNRRAVGFYERIGWQKVPDSSSWEGRMEKQL